jgi:hypothetical protein
MKPEVEVSLGYGESLFMLIKYFLFLTKSWLLRPRRFANVEKTVKFEVEVDHARSQRSRRLRGV